MAQPFMIVTHPRTGSTWLCDALDSHPQVLCHHEVFHRDAVWYSPRHAPAEADRVTVAERDADPYGFLARLLADDRGRAAVGFKMMAGHAPNLTAALLREPRLRKIVLRRENRARVYVSERRAAAVNSWKDVNYTGLAVTVDPVELTAYAEHYDAYYRWVESSVRDQPALFLTYETLFTPASIAAALTFLGVETDVSLVAPSPKPQSSDSLREAIANYDELLEALGGTQLEPDLRAA